MSVLLSLSYIERFELDARRMYISLRSLVGVNFNAQ